MARQREEGEDALVGNAADAKQVKEAAGKEKRLRQRQLDDIRVTLSTREARRLFWRFLGFCGTTRTVKGATDADTNYNAGAQNVGFMMMGEVVEADEELLFQMMRENQKEKGT